MIRRNRMSKIVLGTGPGRAGSEPQGVGRAGSTSMIRRGRLSRDRYQSIT
jgi:hypothetical protein